MSIKVLPFADPDPTLTYKWMHPGRTALKCKESELTVEKVSHRNCKDFYTCEISKDGKPYLSVYYCLRPEGKLTDPCVYTNCVTPLCVVEGDVPVSDDDQLFEDARQATKDVRSDWYSLAIELGIDYGTRKVRLVCLVVYELYHLKPHPQAIESDYRFVDVCFHAVLRHWVRRTSPPLTWTALVRALKSPVINRGDIAEEIELKLVSVYSSLYS